jgi:hypothetical protein
MDQPISPTPPVLPQTPVEPEKPKKSYTWLLILALFVLAAGLSFFAWESYRLKSQLAQVVQPSIEPSSSVNSTAGWKTYSNEALGFSFSYPEEYQVEERVPGFLLIVKPSENVAQAGISLETRLNSPYQTYASAQEYIKNTFDLLETKKINQWEVFKAKGKEGMLIGLEFRLAIAPYKTGAIEMDVLENTDYVNNLDQILSTFKFSNTEQTAVKTDKKIAYIRSLTPGGEYYLITIDYIDFIEDNSQPDGYKIENPSKETVTMPLSQSAEITLATYANSEGGDFTPYKPSVSQFIEIFNSNPSVQNMPYWLETSHDTVTKITEQYIP